MKLLLIRRTR